MPSLIGSIARFARSPQGRRLAAQAMRYASDPKTRAKIDAARKRLLERDEPRPAAPGPGRWPAAAPDATPAPRPPAPPGARRCRRTPPRRGVPRRDRPRDPRSARSALAERDPLRAVGQLEH